jgi:hypothetical protein
MMEVPPPCGEHAGLNRHPRVKAVKDDKQNIIRERTDSIFILVRNDGIFIPDLQSRKEMCYGN